MLTEEINHVESKVERILEMSFDHTAAMISLLNAEADELKAGAEELHKIYRTGRVILRENAEGLKQYLEMLKKGNKLEAFQHKCQEFGI